MNLTEHFGLSEFTRSDVAKARGIKNVPSEVHIKNLQQVATQMEKVRALLNKHYKDNEVKLKITSGYRCPALNSAVGGSKSSDHMNGLAADFVCVKGEFTPRQVCELIREGDIKFDQLIYEQTWVHLGIGAKMRGQVFSLRGGKRANGIVDL